MAGMLGNLVEKKIRWLLIILAAWAVAAYLVIPRMAKLYYRHHFTDAPRITQTGNGRSVWFASATFDQRVGLSHATGQVTHHIGPDVDAERDLIMTGLQKAGWVQDEYYVDGFQASEGRNGGGDRWRTDGSLGAVVLKK